nr:hypothetical protein [Helicobacter pylori]
MVEGIKVGGFLFLVLCPCNGDFTGFDHLGHSISHALKKVLLLDCRGKISPLVRVNYSIITKF